MKFFNQVFWLALLRFLIYLRQKLGWMTLLVGVALVPLAMLVARVSFVGPEKIFWDFSLGISFLLQVVLASYLGSHVLEEERTRKTLHVLCAGRVTRTEWLWGQVIGIWALLTVMSIVWFAITWVTSSFTFESHLQWIQIQSQVFLSIEVALITSMSVLLSTCLRPALSWLSMIALLIVLHSVSVLVELLQQQMFRASGESEVYNYLFKALYFLPPLEWFDLRLFVGYEEVFPWGNFWVLALLGGCWQIFLMLLSQRQLNRMDL